MRFLRLQLAYGERPLTQPTVCHAICDGVRTLRRSVHPRHFRYGNGGRDGSALGPHSRKAARIGCTSRLRVGGIDRHHFLVQQLFPCLAHIELYTTHLDDALVRTACDTDV